MTMTLKGDVRQSTVGVSRRTRRLGAAAAALVVVSAVPTFVVEGILNGSRVMNGSARGTALTMFALALPVLAVGLGTSTRGSVWRQVALIGALAYLTYNATLLAYATPFNELFLAYVALLGLSLCPWSARCSTHCRSWNRAANCPRAGSPRSS